MIKKLRRKMSNETIMIIFFLFIFILVSITFTLLHGSFLSTRNFKLLFQHMSVTALAALGLTFVIIVGHFDMSFHMVGCFAGMTASFMIGEGYLPLPSIILGLLVGLIFGFVNGIAIGKFNLPDMIITIGTGSIAFGLGYLYSGGAFIYDNFLVSGILKINNSEWLGIPFPTILMIITYFIAYMVLSRSKYGRYFYATGVNKKIAIFSGIRVKLYIIIAFIISAFLSSLATILITSAQGVGNVKAGLNLLMPAYASIYIGISVFRKPTVIGTLFGALFTSIMLNGFTLMNIPFYFQDLTISSVMIITIIFSKKIIINLTTQKTSTVQTSDKKVAS